MQERPSRSPLSNAVHARALRAVPLLLAGGLALSACAGTAAVNRGDYTPGYQVSDLIHAGRDEGVPLTVLGDPFGTGDAAATAATAERMRVPGWAPQVDFRPRRDGDSSWGVVLAFDPPLSASPRQVCSAQYTGELTTRSAPNPESDEGRLIAAFCNGGPLSSTRATVPTLSGANDPAFRELLSQISLTLFPPYNPDMRDSDEQRIRPSL